MCGLFSRGAFKVLGLGLGFYLFSPLKVFDHIPLFVDAIAGIHLRSPALFVFDFGNDFVCRLNIETSVRLNNFLRVRMRPVYGNMEVIIARVLVQGIERLMFGQAHSSEKKTDRLIHLFAGRLFVFLP